MVEKGRSSKDRELLIQAVKELREYLYRVRQVYDHSYSSQVPRRWWPAFVLLDDMKDHLPFLIQFLEMDMEESEKPPELEWPGSLIEFETRTGRRIKGPRAFNNSEKRALYFQSNGQCGICRLVLGSDWHADHIKPWSRGGLTTIENGMALCPTCNHRKNATEFGGLE